MNLQHESVTKTPTKAMRELISAGLFGLSNGSADSTVLNQYFIYYDDEVRKLSFGDPYERQTASLAIKTHSEVVKVVEILRKGADDIRPGLRQKLKVALFPAANESELNRAIDVALRLWLMINVREQDFRSSSTLQRPCVQWDDSTMLKKFLQDMFPHPRWDVTPREGRYDPHFTIAFMVKVCGLKIKWTTSLEDHLRLDHSRGSKTLWVFPFKSYLNNVYNNEACLISKECLTGRDRKLLLSRQIVKEAINTLLLLFPIWDDSTITLLHRHNQEFLMEEPLTPDRSLGISDFKFWRDRLLELHQEIFVGQSGGWRQWLYDRRNPQQWLAFWLALVIALMTLVGTVAGVLSAIFAAIQIWGSNGPEPVCQCFTLETDIRHVRPSIPEHW